MDINGGVSSGNGAMIPLNNRGSQDKLYIALWFACAGPNANIPLMGDKVFYFPQGHAEQLQALYGEEGASNIPRYNVPSKILCKVVNVQLKAEAQTDEVYAEITLIPYDKNVPPVSAYRDALPFYKANVVYSFSKVLTHSDTNTHGGFSVPKRFAEECFPRLDMSMQPPAQELRAKDLNGFEWRFRHIYRGHPKRHLLTSGWSSFVSSKRLVAGDTCIFIRGEDGELRIGVRHATQRRQAENPPVYVVPQVSLQHGILASASHSISTGSLFIVYNRPWTVPAPFVVRYDKYMEAAAKAYLPGMRFRFGPGSNESPEKRHTGTILAVEDHDSMTWPDSHWKCLKVKWDGGSNAPLPDRVSPWEITLIPSDRTDAFVQPLPKRRRETNHRSHRSRGTVKKGLVPNPRQNGVLQGQEISKERPNGLGTKMAHFVPQVTPPPPSAQLKRKRMLQFPIYPSPSLLGGSARTGLSNPRSLLSSTLGTSSNSISQDYVEQRRANANDEGMFHRQLSDSDKFMLFGINLFNTHPELRSPNGEVLSSRSVRAMSNSELRRTSEVPRGVSGLLSEKQCSSSIARSCVKVLKYGTALGRSVDLAHFRGYKELIFGIDQMFEFRGSLIDESSGWKLTYIDDEGDLMLVGDCEWQAFRVAARKIFIFPKEEIKKMKPKSIKSGIFSSDD